MIGDGPDATLILRITPAVGVLAVEGSALDVHHQAIVGKRGQPVRRAPGNAVVEPVDQCAGGVDAVDETGVEVAGEELAADIVEGDVADARAAVGVDVGEFADLRR